MSNILEFDAKRHKYYADGREMPSVTQILQANGLISPHAIDEAAAWRGSEVHRLCYEDDINVVDLRKTDIPYRGYLRAWRKFRQDAGFVPKLIEHRVDSMQFGYSGRLDRVGNRPGQRLRVMLDIKTNKQGQVGDYVRYQLAAYALALEPAAIFERIAVVLKPDGNYNTRIFSVADFGLDRAKWVEYVTKFKAQIQ